MIILRIGAGNHGNDSFDWIECALCVLVILPIAVTFVRAILELRKEKRKDEVD